MYASYSLFAQTVSSCSEAVDQLAKGLPREWLKLLQITPEKDLKTRDLDLGRLIRDSFSMHSNNRLVRSCGQSNANDASMVILEQLWRRLVC
jgi:hypothetical protein